MDRPDDSCVGNKYISSEQIVLVWQTDQVTIVNIDARATDIPVYSIQATASPSSASDQQSLCINNPPVPCVFENKNEIDHTKTTTTTTRNLVLRTGGWVSGQKPFTRKILTTTKTWTRFVSKTILHTWTSQRR